MYYGLAARYGGSSPSVIRIGCSSGLEPDSLFSWDLSLGEELNTIAPVKAGTRHVRNGRRTERQSGSPDSRARTPRLPPLDSPAPTTRTARRSSPIWPVPAAGAPGSSARRSSPVSPSPISLWAVSARADETSHLLTLGPGSTARSPAPRPARHDLAAVMDTAERVYEHSAGQVADPATRDVLAQALAEARQAVAQRVTDAPPTSVTQARTLLAQATHMETRSTGPRRTCVSPSTWSSSRRAPRASWTPGIRSATGRCSRQTTDPDRPASPGSQPIGPPRE